MARLHEAYASTGLVLAVGAGMSSGSHLPNWEKFLARLARRRFGARGPGILKNLRKFGLSLPAVAAILEAGVPRTQFGEMMRDELYAEFPFYRVGVTDRNRHKFVSFVERNGTLAAVARLCVDDTPSGPVRNPRIHAIINFNFDAVFRQYIRAKFGSDFVRTVERPSAGSIPGRIPVYHVHGFFRFDEKRFGDLTAEAPDVRVFTEQEYFDFFNRPTAVYTYTFLHLLREFPCLFIGVSLLDDNLRRLLHYSRSERIESDRREGTSLRSAEERSLRHFTLYRRSGDRSIDRHLERSLLRLGLSVIWVDRFEEMPALLDGVHRTGHST